MGKILTAVFLLALATYLTRLVPLLLALKKQNTGQGVRKTIRQLFEYIAPSLIAALFVISITPLTTNISLDGGFHLGFALTAVLISHFIWKNPGISVLIGVAAYAGAHIL